MPIRASVMPWKRWNSNTRITHTPQYWPNDQ